MANLNEGGISPTLNGGWHQLTHFGKISKLKKDGKTQPSPRKMWSNWYI
jgi:hypothetical protein